MIKNYLIGNPWISTIILKLYKLCHLLQILWLIEELLSICHLALVLYCSHYWYWIIKTDISWFIVLQFILLFTLQCWIKFWNFWWVFYLCPKPILTLLQNSSHLFICCWVTLPFFQPASFYLLAFLLENYSSLQVSAWFLQLWSSLPIALTSSWSLGSMNLETCYVYIYNY